MSKISGMKNERGSEAMVSVLVLCTWGTDGERPWLGGDLRAGEEDKGEDGSEMTRPGICSEQGRSELAPFLKTECAYVITRYD